MNDGYIYRRQVGTEGAGLTVLDYHVRRFGHSDEAAWREHVEAARVLVNGAPVTCGRRLEAGDVLEFRRPPWEEPPAPVGFAVVHEDEHLIAVDKPAGLQVLPGGRFLERTLLRAVRAGLRERAEWSPVHRLGRGTSGIVLFGKTEPARAFLSAQFRERTAAKLYLAVVQGGGSPESFVARQPIGAVAHGRGRAHAVVAGGKRSLTRLRTLRRDDVAGTGLVAAKPVTGRPDQIRIHLAACGWPILGDPLYERGGGLREGARPGDVGYLLHGAALRVRHPATGEWLRLRCIPPPEWPMVGGPA